MSEPTLIHPGDVQFGDCDPAGFRSFRTSRAGWTLRPLAFFIARGVPPWRELVKTRGIIGTPILELNVRYLKAATYGERIEVHTRIDAWAARTFRYRHVVRRGADVLCEATETRAFVIRDPADPDRIRAIPIPEDIKLLCS